MGQARPHTVQQIRLCCAFRPVGNRQMGKGQRVPPSEQAKQGFFLTLLGPMLIFIQYYFLLTATGIINMPVFNRIKCPKCNKKYDIRSKNNAKQFECKKENCKHKIILNGHNCNYYVEYQFEGKKFRQRIGPSKALAENVYRKIMVEIAEEKYLDKKKKIYIKFKDFGDKYLKEHSMVRNKSWKGSDAVSIKALNKYFSNKFLHEITYQDVQKFQISRAKDVSNATVNRNLACLKSMFNRAIEWEQFDGLSPAKRVKFLKENNTRERYLKKEETARLLQNADEKLRPILIVALNTGMRRGEIFGLEWKNIDFGCNTIHLYETKNGKERTVPMNREVKEILMKLHKNSQSSYVFAHKDGSQIRGVRKSFFTALVKSGISNFRFHDLRHCFCSNLVMRGIDLNTVRELAGHKSIQMTLRYSHLSPDHKQRAVDMLSNQMDSVSEQKVHPSDIRLQGEADIKKSILVTV